MIAARVLALATALLAAACQTVSTAATPPGVPGTPTVIAGTLKTLAGQPLSGLLLVEKGELHGNVWDRGTRIENGTFRLEVAEGGQYGLHFYASGYFYRPQAVRVETGATLTIDAVLAAEPTREHDPVIRRAGFFPWESREGKVSFVKIDVTDSNDNLGPQVMAFNSRTGRAHAMAPPVPVKDLKAKFPQGVYQLEVDTSQAPLDPREWHFVVADHACFTSDILSFPHEPQPPRVVK
jgi:hypothetical protein